MIGLKQCPECLVFNLVGEHTCECGHEFDAEAADAMDTALRAMAALRAKLSATSDSD